MELPRVPGGRAELNIFARHVPRVAESDVEGLGEPGTVRPRPAPPLLFVGEHQLARVLDSLYIGEAGAGELRRSGASLPPTCVT